MKKTASILINRDDNTAIKVCDNGKVVEFYRTDYAASYCIYPINMQRIVCGDVRTAETLKESWDIAYQMFDEYKASGVDFADNYDLSKG